MGRYDKFKTGHGGENRKVTAQLQHKLCYIQEISANILGYIQGNYPDTFQILD